MSNTNLNINSFKDTIDGILVDIGVAASVGSDEKSETVMDNFGNKLSYYFTKKFTFDMYELSSNHMDEIFRPINAYVNNIKQSSVYKSIIEENDKLKKEAERLKPFETYYNMHYNMSHGKKAE